jgi:hypothetical protein
LNLGSLNLGSLNLGSLNLGALNRSAPRHALETKDHIHRDGRPRGDVVV